MSSRRILNIGLIGCGEVAQVVHIPTLLFMRDFFRITYLCDVSAAAVQNAAARIPPASPAVRTTHDPAVLCASPDVDAVIIASSDEYHASQAVLALQNRKSVLIEKPVALTKRDARCIVEAERAAEGVAHAMVGYMRRYAAPLEDAVREIGGLDRILYARVRDIIGPNDVFVGQSGTFAQRFVSDIAAADAADRQARATDMVAEALEECGHVAVTPESTRMWRVLCGLGTHDLSLMREALGRPERVVGSHAGFPFWNCLFQYPGFCVSYESGMDNIPRFDAHLEVYSASKAVRVQYDTPYVKGLPVTMTISENSDGAYKESVIRKTYEDPYTRELQVFWSLVAENKPCKTTVEDAMEDFDILAMMMAHAFQS